MTSLKNYNFNFFYYFIIVSDFKLCIFFSFRYKVTVVPRSPEGGRLNDGKDIWDPFQERERLEHPTS